MGLNAVIEGFARARKGVNVMAFPDPLTLADLTGLVGVVLKGVESILRVILRRR